jgi:hypothetical protein
MTSDEKIARLTEELTYQQNRAEAAETMVEMRDAQIAVLRRTLGETQEQLDHTARVAEYDARERGREDFWTQREATGR